MGVWNIHVCQLLWAYRVIWIQGAKLLLHRTSVMREQVTDYIHWVEKTFHFAYGSDDFQPETKNTMFGQLQQGLRQDLMESPAVSGATNYQSLCLAAKTEERKQATLRQHKLFCKPLIPQMPPAKDRDVHGRLPPHDPTHPKSGHGFQHKRCYQCGQIGHLAKSCRRKPKEGTGMQWDSHARAVHYDRTPLTSYSHCQRMRTRRFARCKSKILLVIHTVSKSQYKECLCMVWLTVGQISQLLVDLFLNALPLLLTSESMTSSYPTKCPVPMTRNLSVLMAGWTWMWFWREGDADASVCKNGCQGPTSATCIWGTLSKTRYLVIPQRRWRSEKEDGSSWVEDQLVTTPEYLPCKSDCYSQLSFHVTECYDAGNSESRTTGCMSPTLCWTKCRGAGNRHGGCAVETFTQSS